MSSTESDRSILRDQASRFALQHAHFGMLGRGATNGRAFATALSHDGWREMLASEDRGGSALGLSDFVIVAEAFGRKLLPSIAAAVVGRSALGLWSEDHDDPEESQVVAALAATPAERERRVVEVEGDDKFMLRGEVTTSAPVDASDRLIIDAICAGQPVLVIVSLQSKDAHSQGVEGVDGGRRTTIVFNGVALPRSCVIPASDAMTKVTDLSAAFRLGLTAELLGCVSETFDRTLAYMRMRRQFGKAISEFQALQHRSTDMFVDLELSRALVYEAARLVDGAADATAIVAAARSRMCKTAGRVLRWSAQMHGAIGFTDECEIGLFLKRIVVATRDHTTAGGERRLLAAARERGAQNLFDLFRSDTQEHAAFRSEVRDFLTTTLPSDICDLPTRPKVEVADWWHRQLFEKGWIAPAWPKIHGGMEASVEQRLILFEELALRGAPELSSQAIYHIGPTLIRFGTPKQQERHLPSMLNGTARWCQGYSEPNSGSDLASIQSQGEVLEDRIIVNGQKIWTTGGHVAHWMFALVRTDKAAADRRRGISMVLIDLSSEGVRRRPIRTIAGEDEFAEVFFDNVIVPKDNVVGGLNNGWEMANAVLDNERLISSTPQKIIVLLDRVRLVAQQCGSFEDPAFLDRFIEAEIDVLSFTAAFGEALKLLKREAVPKSIASVLKVANGEILQNLADLMLEAAGPDGANLPPIEVDGRRIHVGRSFLQARRATIYGGTSEIQKNIIARRVLAL